jgi:hypothetical protein
MRVDLLNVVRIIYIAVETGAFKGSGMSGVGRVRDKIAASLSAVAMKTGGAHGAAPGRQ